MRERRRSKEISTDIYLGTSYLDLTSPYGDGPWIYPTLQKLSPWPWAPYVLSEETCEDELHKGPPYLDGGLFDKWSYSTDQYVPKHMPGRKEEDVIKTMWRQHVPASYTNENGVKCGGFVPTYMPSGFLDSMAYLKSSNWGDVSSHGAAAWNRFRPTRSGADMGIFLGEVREIPRMFATTAKGFAQLWRDMGGSLKSFAPKSVANHWLNTQFGWFPFLADLRDFYKTAKNLDKRLKQLRRDNGRWVRRKGVFSNDFEQTVVLNTSNVAGLNPSGSTYHYNSPKGYQFAMRKQTQRVWFSGAFRYWIPGDPDSWWWNARATGLLFGLRPSPSLLWELTPWSWLIDWWSDVGDAIANISSIYFDNLCAKYAYLMAHTTQEVQYAGMNNFITGPVKLNYYAKIERKQRIEASPFGFGLTGGDFTNRQWSILGALGISRIKY